MLAQLQAMFENESDLVKQIVEEYKFTLKEYEPTASKKVLQNFIFVYRFFIEFSGHFLDKDFISLQSPVDQICSVKSNVQQLRQYYTSYQHSHHKHIPYHNIFDRLQCLASISNCLAVQDGSALLEEARLLDLMKRLVVHADFGFSYLSKIAIRRFLIRLKFSQMLCSSEKINTLTFSPSQVLPPSTASVSSMSSVTMKQVGESANGSKIDFDESTIVTAKDIESLYHSGIECLRLLNSCGDWTGT